MRYLMIDMQCKTLTTEHFLEEAICFAKPNERVKDLSQVGHIIRTPRWMDRMCLGMFIHRNLSEHPAHGH